MAIKQCKNHVKPTVVTKSMVESTLKNDECGESHFRLFDVSFRVLALKKGADEMVESVKRFIESIKMKRPE